MTPRKGTQKNLFKKGERVYIRGQHVYGEIKRRVKELENYGGPVFYDVEFYYRNGKKSRRRIASSGLAESYKKQVQQDIIELASVYADAMNEGRRTFDGFIGFCEEAGYLGDNVIKVLTLQTELRRRDWGGLPMGSWLSLWGVYAHLDKQDRVPELVRGNEA